MGCCNEPANVLENAVFDPTQHVNFAKGMVLGVDDFRQEFAYLSGRDQWLVRDAIGYGTASGLRVSVDSAGSDGLRLYVTAGSAFVPSGKHVCVTVDQCAVINKWLAKSENGATVNQLLNPSSPPMSPPIASPPSVGDTSGTISLYLTLCYRDCTTRKVPIPGEPCRSDDQLMADSRVADDYFLELRKSAPVQVEEDALRDFARWLRDNVLVTDTSPPPVADEASWLAALRSAAQPWFDAQNASPPLSPPASVATLGDYLFDLSPLDLAVAPDQISEFLRVAVRFWVTELRPMWMAMRCHKPQHADVDCVLLARVEFDVAWSGSSPNGAWQIASSPANVIVDETTRPYLGHLRLLQEFLNHFSSQSIAAAGPAASMALLPDLSGDVSGAITGNIVTKVRGIDVVTTGATNGQTLSFNGTAWVPTPAGISALPNLAGDVDGAITGNTVNRVRGIDVLTTGAAAGQFLGFDGAAWVPTPASTLPGLAGDASGAIAGNTVNRVRGVDVVTTGATNGQVLGFDGTAWVPTPVGNFVNRAAAQSFAIVAAGSVEFPIAPRVDAPATGAVATILNSYNGFAAASTYDPANGGFRFTFAGFDIAATYIVKITPWAPRGSGAGNPFIAYLSDFVPAIRGRPTVPAGFTVTITLNPGLTVTSGRLMIEVSQLG